jgi:hypothetical protein
MHVICTNRKTDYLRFSYRCPNNRWFKLLFLPYLYLAYCSWSNAEQHKNSKITEKTSDELVDTLFFISSKVLWSLTIKIKNLAMLRKIHDSNFFHIKFLDCTNIKCTSAVLGSGFFYYFYGEAWQTRLFLFFSSNHL